MPRGRPPKTDPSHPCLSCGSIRVVKNGKTVDGKQKYLCRDCGTNFVEGARHRYPKWLKEEAIRMYLYGFSKWEIARVLNVPLYTVSYWIRKSGLQKNKFLKDLWLKVKDTIEPELADELANIFES